MSFHIIYQIQHSSFLIIVRFFQPLLFSISLYCWWECRLVQPLVLWKTVWNFLRKLKMELPFDLATPLLGLYPKNPETPIKKNLCTPMFITAQFTIAKCWKQPKCPSVNEWMKKLWYIYIAERKECLPLSLIHI